MSARDCSVPEHVLMTADAVGGVWTYALELARGLSQRGVLITLAVMGPSPSVSQRSDAMAIDGVTLRESDARLEWMDEPWSDVERAGEWLLALDREIAPDIVHLNGYAHANLPFGSPVLVTAHSCVCSWWRAVHGVAAPASWDRYRSAMRAGLQSADLVVAPTAAMLDALVAEHGTPANYCVVPNGRGIDVAPVTKERFILGAGRLWDEAKNVGALLDAAPWLPWPVYVAGATSEPSRDGMRALDGAGHVRLLGTLAPARLAEWMARASIFASPARYEPFGLAALEAARAGCALVLGDIPSQREVWGDAALFVPPDDRDALRNALARLSADPALVAAMAERARRRAGRYTVYRFVDGYLDAYEWLGSTRDVEARSLTA